jgi:hypothetical protein
MPKYIDSSDSSARTLNIYKSTVEPLKDVIHPMSDDKGNNERKEEIDE